jgi:hypothetical protein
MQELSLLARDAAEILWEMVAMGESGAAVADMKSKGEALQAQLRGLIGDYQVRRPLVMWYAPLLLVCVQREV